MMLKMLQGGDLAISETTSKAQTKYKSLLAATSLIRVVSQLSFGTSYMSPKSFHHRFSITTNLIFGL